MARSKRAKAKRLLQSSSVAATAVPSAATVPSSQHYHDNAIDDDNDDDANVTHHHHHQSGTGIAGLLSSYSINDHVSGCQLLNSIVLRANERMVLKVVSRELLSMLKDHLVRNGEGAKSTSAKTAVLMVVKNIIATQLAPCCQLLQDIRVMNTLFGLLSQASSGSDDSALEVEYISELMACIVMYVSVIDSAVDDIMSNDYVTLLADFLNITQSSERSMLLRSGAAEILSVASDGHSAFCGLLQSKAAAAIETVLSGYSSDSRRRCVSEYKVYYHCVSTLLNVQVETSSVKTAAWEQRLCSWLATGVVMMNTVIFNLEHLVSRTVPVDGTLCESVAELVKADETHAAVHSSRLVVQLAKTIKVASESLANVAESSTTFDRSLVPFVEALATCAKITDELVDQQSTRSTSDYSKNATDANYVASSMMETLHALSIMALNIAPIIDINDGVEVLVVESRTLACLRRIHSKAFDDRVFDSSDYCDEIKEAVVASLSTVFQTVVIALQMSSGPIATQNGAIFDEMIGHLTAGLAMNDDSITEHCLNVLGILPSVLVVGASTGPAVTNLIASSEIVLGALPQLFLKAESVSEQDDKEQCYLLLMAALCSIVELHSGDDEELLSYFHDRGLLAQLEMGSTLLRGSLPSTTSSTAPAKQEGDEKWQENMDNINDFIEYKNEYLSKKRRRKN